MAMARQFQTGAVRELGTDFAGAGDVSRQGIRMARTRRAHPGCCAVPGRTAEHGERRAANGSSISSPAFTRLRAFDMASVKT